MTSEAAQETSLPRQPSPTHSARGGRGETDGANSNAQDDGSSSVDHVQEKPAAAGLTKRQKLKQHFKRFWWAHLIALIVILAILLPILFTIIIPKIVQDVVNDQDLPIKGGALVALSPTMMNISLDTSLDTPLPVTIDPLPLDLYQKETEPYTPFLQITLPKNHVNHETRTTLNNDTVHVKDQAELISWFHDVFDKEKVEVSVKGKPDVHLNGLTYHPHMDKTVKVPALNYLKGFGVDEMEFMMPPNEKGYNIKGMLNLPNAGALELYLGNLTFNMRAGDVNLGLVNLYEVDMKHGNNSWYFEGNFYFDALVPNLAAILDSQKDSLSSGSLLLHATGNTSMINGEHIKYVEDVLVKKRIPFTVPVVTLLADVVNGFMGKDKGSLFDLLGDILGNTTMFENALDRFNGTDLLNNFNATDIPDLSDIGKKASSRKAKRSPGSKAMWNMLRLGMRTKKQ